MARKPNEAQNAPTLRRLEDDEHWREIKRRRDETQAELNAVDREIDERQARQRQAYTADNAAVDKVVSDGPAAAATAVAETETDETFDELRRRKRVLSEAIPRLNKQLRERTVEVSKEICQAKRPEYLQRIQELADAVARLGVAVKREEQFREELNNADIQVIDLNVGTPRGEVEDFDPRRPLPQSPVKQWLAEVEQRYGITPNVEGWTK